MWIQKNENENKNEIHLTYRHVFFFVDISHVVVSHDEGTYDFKIFDFNTINSKIDTFFFKKADLHILNKC